MVGHAKMKAGMVAQIRVHPEDCLTVLDLCREMGVDPYDGRSFASMVSTSLKALIGLAIKMKVVKEPEYGQFLNAMAPFLDSRNNKSKHRHSEQLYRNAAIEDGQVPSIDVPMVSGPGTFVPEHAKEAPSQPRIDPTLSKEFTLLLDKFESGVELPPEEKARYDYLLKTLFPL